MRIWYMKKFDFFFSPQIIQGCIDKKFTLDRPVLQTCAPGRFFLSSCWTGRRVCRDSAEMRWVPKEQTVTTWAITQGWYRAQPDHFAKAGSQVRTVWPLRPAKYCTIICTGLREIALLLFTPSIILPQIYGESDLGLLLSSSQIPI